jgi:hypothetical protein
VEILKKGGPTILSNIARLQDAYKKEEYRRSGMKERSSCYSKRVTGKTSRIIGP